jgi:hypothetical protein
MVSAKDVPPEEAELVATALAVDAPGRAAPCWADVTELCRLWVLLEEAAIRGCRCRTTTTVSRVRPRTLAAQHLALVACADNRYLSQALEETLTALEPYLASLSAFDRRKLDKDCGDLAAVRHDVDAAVPVGVLERLVSGCQQAIARTWAGAKV